jgi:hypothetical protein
MMMMAMVVNCAVSLTSVGFSINPHGGVAVELELFSNFMVNELYPFIGPTTGAGILLCFPV